MSSYNPGISSYGGALLAQGLGRGISNLADSHRRAGAILEQQREKDKLEERQVRGLETLIAATPMLSGLMSERLGMDMERFKSLSREQKLAIGEGLLQVPGMLEASKRLEALGYDNKILGVKAGNAEISTALQNQMGVQQLSGMTLANMKGEQELRGLPERLDTQDAIGRQRLRGVRAEADAKQFEAENAERFLTIKEVEAQSGKTRADSYAEQTRLASLKWDRENGAAPDDFSMVNFFGMDRAAIEAVIKAETNPKKRANKLQAAQRYFKYLQEQNKAYDDGGDTEVMGMEGPAGLEIKDYEKRDKW